MGVYGYRSPKSDPDVVNPKKLGEPVGEGKPVSIKNNKKLNFSISFFTHFNEIKFTDGIICRRGHKSPSL